MNKHIRELRLGRVGLEATLHIVESCDLRRVDVLRQIDSVRGRARALVRAAVALRLADPDHAEHAFSFEISTLTGELELLKKALSVHLRELDGYRMSEPDNDASTSISLTIELLTGALATMTDSVKLMGTLARRAAHEKARSMRERMRTS